MSAVVRVVGLPVSLGHAPFTRAGQLDRPGMQSGGSGAEGLLQLPSEFTSASVRCVRVFPSLTRFLTRSW